jgi:hypothetical protein
VSGAPDRPADPLATIPRVRVAVIDVGSNSIRLLVAAIEPGGDANAVERDRVYLRLGDDAYRFGSIGARKLDELEFVAERFALRARALGAERIETIVHRPGRQASNADELVDVLADATRAQVLVLSAADEARLAWEGAVAALEAHPRQRGSDRPGRRVVRDCLPAWPPSAPHGSARATPGRSGSPVVFLPSAPDTRRTSSWQGRACEIC